jgi:RNA polymerase sigma-70 factor (ECF subfamily)
MTPFAGHRVAGGNIDGSSTGTGRPRYGLTVREELGPDPAGLVDRLRQGDRGAFEELVRRYQNRVFGVSFRMLGNRADAEEVSQELFLRVYRKVGDFRGDSKLSTWLYAIASRLCLNRLASGRVRPTHEVDDAVLGIESSDADPGEDLERAEVQAALQRAIAELPEERRIVVVLRDLEGLAYEDIAHALGLEIGTVRSRLHRARAELKGKMERFLR